MKNTLNMCSFQIHSQHYTHQRKSDGNFFSIGMSYASFYWRRESSVLVVDYTHNPVVKHVFMNRGSTNDDLRSVSSIR